MRPVYVWHIPRRIFRGFSLNNQFHSPFPLQSSLIGLIFACSPVILFLFILFFLCLFLHISIVWGHDDIVISPLDYLETSLCYWLYYLYIGSLIHRGIVFNPICVLLRAREPPNTGTYGLRSPPTDRAICSEHLA